MCLDISFVGTKGTIGGNLSTNGIIVRTLNDLNLNLNSLLVKRQVDNPSPGAVTGGNHRSNFVIFTLFFSQKAWDQ